MICIKPLYEFIIYVDFLARKENKVDNNRIHP